MRCNNYETTSTPYERMKKTDLLLQMMEQPWEYSDQEWQEILADEECRELYTLMAKTKSAISADKTDLQVTEDVVDAEWRKLEKGHFSQSISMVYRYAAMIVGVLMLTGIAYAAIHFLSTPRQQVEKEQGSHTQETQMANADLSEAKTEDFTMVADTIVPPSPRLFDNVPLEQILNELSDYYHINVAFQNQKARQVRMFYQWKPEFTLEKVVEMLNNFETLHISLEDNTLIVSSEEQYRQ